MSSSITLRRTTVIDPWLQAVMADYEIPENPHIFTATTDDDERMAFFVGEDGGGFCCIDAKHREYVAAQAEFAKSGNFDLMAAHGGVDEYVIDAGTLDYNAEELEESTVKSLF